MIIEVGPGRVYQCLKNNQYHSIGQNTLEVVSAKDFFFVVILGQNYINSLMKKFKANNNEELFNKIKRTRVSVVFQ